MQRFRFKLAGPPPERGHVIPVNCLQGLHIYVS